jgi:hypothetical protein
MPSSLSSRSRKTWTATTCTYTSAWCHPTFWSYLSTNQHVQTLLLMSVCPFFHSCCVSELAGPPSLHSHHLRQKAQLCRCIIHSESIIPSSYFQPVYQLNCISYSLAITFPFARTTLFQKPFFVSLCTLWKSLPSDVIILITARAFKEALSCSPSFLFWLVFTHSWSSLIFSPYFFMYKFLSHVYFCGQPLLLAFSCFLVALCTCIKSFREKKLLL